MSDAAAVPAVLAAACLARLTVVQLRPPRMCAQVLRADAVAVLLAVLVLPPALTLVTLAVGVAVAAALDNRHAPVKVAVGAAATALCAAVALATVAALPLTGWWRAGVAAVAFVVGSVVVRPAVAASVATLARGGGRPAWRRRARRWAAPAVLAEPGVAAVGAVVAHAVAAHPATAAWWVALGLALAAPLARSRERHRLAAEQLRHTLDLVGRLAEATSVADARSRLEGALTGLPGPTPVRLSTASPSDGELGLAINPGGPEPWLWLVTGRQVPSKLHRTAVDMLASVCAVATQALRTTSLTEALRRQAHQDPVTGLANRRSLAEHARRDLARAGRDGTRCGIVYLDLDGFKQVNDDAGHQVGDRLLQDIATALVHTARAGDVVARVGGDELVVWLGEVFSPEEVTAVGERMAAAVAATSLYDDGTLAVTASRGTAIAPEDGTTLDALLHAADRRMYEAKRARRVRSPS